MSTTIKAKFDRNGEYMNHAEFEGMTKKEFKRLEHAQSIGEACELTLACEGNPDVPEENYYDVKLADGSTFDAVCGSYFIF